MARIINLRKTLRLIGMRGVGQFVIEIEDSVLPEIMEDLKFPMSIQI